MTLTHDPQNSTTLSVLFRDGSKVEHEAAESSSFISELLAGRVNERGYADYLARLQRVYRALEDVGRALRNDPLVVDLFDVALERSAAIAADIEHWGRGHADTAATDAYVARLDEISRSPIEFIAHHYTRYLGDLSGGRAIGQIVKKTFGLTDSGAAFYEFVDIPKPKPYKDAYRARLDALPLTEDEKYAALAEVKAVFGYNGAIFAELTADLDRYRR